MPVVRRLIEFSSVSSGGSVAYYRLYFLHRFSGHIEHFSDFQAEADTAAIAYAEESASERPMELWCGSRKVRRWDAITPSPY